MISCFCPTKQTSWPFKKVAAHTEQKITIGLFYVANCYLEASFGKQKIRKSKVYFYFIAQLILNLLIQALSCLCMVSSSPFSEISDEDLFCFKTTTTARSNCLRRLRSSVFMSAHCSGKAEAQTYQGITSLQECAVI